MNKLDNYTITGGEINVGDYFVAYGIVGKCTEVDDYDPHNINYDSEETKWTCGTACEKVELTKGNNKKTILQELIDIRQKLARLDDGTTIANFDSHEEYNEAWEHRFSTSLHVDTAIRELTKHDKLYKKL